MENMLISLCSLRLLIGKTLTQHTNPHVTHCTLDVASDLGCTDTSVYIVLLAYKEPTHWADCNSCVLFMWPVENETLHVEIRLLRECRLPSAVSSHLKSYGLSLCMCNVLIPCPNGILPYYQMGVAHARMPDMYITSLSRPVLVLQTWVVSR